MVPGGTPATPNGRALLAILQFSDVLVSGYHFAIGKTDLTIYNRYVGMVSIPFKLIILWKRLHSRLHQAHTYMATTGPGPDKKPTLAPNLHHDGDCASPELSWAHRFASVSIFLRYEEARHAVYDPVVVCAAAAHRECSARLRAKFFRSRVVFRAPKHANPF